MAFSIVPGAGIANEYFMEFVMGIIFLSAIMFAILWYKKCGRYHV